MATYLHFLFLTIFIGYSYAVGSVAGSDSSKEASQGESADSETTKFIKVEEPLSFECGLDIKEPAQIKWYKDNQLLNDNERFKVENRTLTIISAVEEDYGYYRCQVGAEHFDVSVISLSYKKMTKSLTVLEGEKLKLECDVTGMPLPSIVWFKNNEVVDKAFNESHYDLKPNEEGTPNGTLEILHAEMDDRGEYMCFISSQGARFNTTVMVRVKNMYAALWPFLGICAEVIILCLIIFIYEKRRIKNDFEESDTEPTDQKNTSDHKDLRQRK